MIIFMDINCNIIEKENEQIVVVNKRFQCNPEHELVEDWCYMERNAPQS